MRGVVEFISFGMGYYTSVCLYVVQLGVGEYPERLGEPPCQVIDMPLWCNECWRISYSFLFCLISKLVLCLFTCSLNVQYYLRTGTCKFGMSCKFNHPKNAGGSLTSAPLNSYGYPLRPVIICCMLLTHVLCCKRFWWSWRCPFQQGEQECSYYLKTGQCKFGITCKFDHPQSDGTSVSASARPFYPTVQSLSSPTPEQYDSATSSYRVARPSLLPGSYVSGAYGHMLLPGVVPIPNWNPHSVGILIFFFLKYEEYLLETISQIIC